MSSPKDYRDRFHRPTDPAQGLEGFVDQRDSLVRIYVSLVPFLVAEYYSELHYDFLPPALIFPIGFLLFWAFYYTYYKPGFLEELGRQGQWNLSAIPLVVLGVSIWFVRITVVELLHFVALRWIVKPAPRARPAAEAGAAPEPPPAREQTASFRRPEPPRGETEIPAELVRSLQTLGLKGSPSWDEIHHRYRELAKLFHPDLNPDVTDFGRRFIAIDQAYRRLGRAKGKYFSASP
jgi:hypothetical protein